MLSLTNLGKEVGVQRKRHIGSENSILVGMRLFCVCLTNFPAAKLALLQNKLKPKDPIN